MKNSRRTTRRELSAAEMSQVSGGRNDRNEITQWYRARGFDGPDWAGVDRLNRSHNSMVNDIRDGVSAGAAGGAATDATNGRAPSVRGGVAGALVGFTAAVANQWSSYWGGGVDRSQRDGTVTVEEISN
ncbi:hypothetical protein [Eilatimonas milleporae]|uniref:Uncharacterized protein n=1 Tax=Eilatimonas milleporae TaxID=911205 RepID=A0A3M0CY91_9PROT|nr:hypothetical protein [Eilatimonas milleporae]RMB09013.1 hypothetical protein BXY39_1660 [Eilatimonas milleporae]